MQAVKIPKKCTVFMPFFSSTTVQCKPTENSFIQQQSPHCAVACGIAEYIISKWKNIWKPQILPFVGM